MRIIAGKWRGHRLASFQADHIRPTTDQVKGSLFNSWQADIAGAVVLDLFCGTGNLGLEALSRDAAHVTFVEQNQKSLNVLKKNLDLLKVERKECAVVQKDVFAFLKGCTKVFDLIMIDPPFTEKLGDSVLQALSQAKCWSTQTKIAIEFSRIEKRQDNYGRLALHKKREFGDKLLCLYFPSEENPGG